MKKLLGILVLGLFFHNTAFSQVSLEPPIFLENEEETSAFFNLYCEYGAIFKSGNIIPGLEDGWSHLSLEHDVTYANDKKTPLQESYSFYLNEVQYPFGRFPAKPARIGIKGKIFTHEYMYKAFSRRYLGEWAKQYGNEWERPWFLNDRFPYRSGPKFNETIIAISELEVTKNKIVVKLVQEIGDEKDDPVGYITETYIISLNSGKLELLYNLTPVRFSDIDETFIRYRGSCIGTKDILAYFTLDQDNIRTAGATETSGTAFFINNKGNLLTNNHVVEGCKAQKINYFNKEYDTKIITTDNKLDLALLKAEVVPKSYISFSKDVLKKRQTIIAAGYPLGKYLSDDLKINDGKISALKGFDNNSNEIQHDIPINPGNSGGPIVNQKGQLVAIAVSGMSKDVTEGINFGIKYSAVEVFLKSNKISPSFGYMNFSMNDDKLVKLLEESTVYTFCEQ